MSELKIARYWECMYSSTVKCNLCPHYCELVNESMGKCGVRVNINGALFSTNYGKVTSVALDPVEKNHCTCFTRVKKLYL